jgi:intron-binding protein aquarius
MSIVYMVNEKFRERVPAWVPFQKKPENFQIFFKKVLDLSLVDNTTNPNVGDKKNGAAADKTTDTNPNAAGDKKNGDADKATETKEEEVIKISLKEQTALIIFLGHCFMSMEVDLVRFLFYSSHVNKQKIMKSECTIFVLFFYKIKVFD